MAARWLLLSLLVLGSGCAVVQDQQADLEQILRPLRRGDMPRAVAAAKASAKDEDDSGSAAVAWLEAGAVLQAAGRFEESIGAFDKARQHMADLDARATVSARDAGSELAALVTNAKVLPYEGSQADRILMPTLQAVNYLAIGKPDGARVELNRAYDRQKAAVAEFRKAIDAAGGTLRNQQIDPGQVNAGQARRALQHQGQPPLTAYADFVNPLTVYLDGLFFMATAENGSDLERARKSLERMASFNAEPGVFAPEMNYLAARQSGGKPAPAVVVLALTGLAPGREEWRLDLPIPVRPVVHAGIALPRLAFEHDSPAPVVPGAPPMRLVADLNSVVAREFDETFDAVVIRTVAAATTRAVAQAQLQRKLGDAAWIAGVVGSIVVNQADLRCWRTAPAYAQRTWLPRPQDGRLELQAQPGLHAQIISLPDSPLVLVFVRRIPGAQPVIAVIPM